MNGELRPTEPHPALFSAIEYLGTKLYDPLIEEAFASCAIESNRLAEICLETIRRMKNKEIVSDRYLLGLAWALKWIEENEQKWNDS